MAYKIHIPGERSRSLRWTTDHPQSSFGNGVLIYRNSSDVLDGITFRFLRDRRGAWLETDQPERARRALTLTKDEALGEPPRVANDP